MSLRTARNFNALRSTLSSGTVNDKPSKTVQSDFDQTDINLLVRRFGITGDITANRRVPLDVDFAEVVDFQSAMNQIRAAQENFADLPSSTRKYFSNDPGEFLRFMSDPGNVSEAVRLGLGTLVPSPTPAPAPAAVPSPVPAPVVGST